MLGTLGGGLDRQTGTQKCEQKMGTRRTYKSSRLEDGLKASITDDYLSELRGTAAMPDHLRWLLLTIQLTLY